MADYTFLEYSYNPECEITADQDVSDRLENLGFVCKAIHDSDLHSLWTQRQIILCVRKADVLIPGITGVGFNFSQSELDSRCLGINFDAQTDMYVGMDFQGLRILGMPDEITLDEYNYTKPQDNTLIKQNGMENVTGLIYNTHNDIQDDWKDMGFKFHNSEKNSIVSPNNRLSVMLKNSIHEQRIPTIVVDTHDVFDTTINLLCAGIETLNVPMEEELDFGDELNYKIRAYNCVAIGNANSYSIEKFVPDALPGLNIIVRMRKRYMNLAEYPLDRFYANDT
jgi:hypothetical protein